MPKSFLVKQRKICKQLKEDDLNIYSDEESNEGSNKREVTREKEKNVVNRGSPVNLTKDKEEKNVVQEKDKQTPHVSSQNVHQLFPTGTAPIYVFSSHQPIRPDHVTTPIPVQYVHPNFCYPPYIHYDTILSTRVLPKEQIPPVADVMAAQNRMRNGKDSGTLPLSIATNPASLSNGNVVPTPQILQQHLIMENGGKEKKYECHVCKSTFSLQRLLNRHMKTHSFYKRYQCPYCDKGFNDTFDLKRHVRTHTGIKPFKCNLCDKAFTQRCSLEAHKTRVHGVVYEYGFRERRAKLYVCEDCGETFQESGDYMKHLQEKHPDSAAKTRFKRSLQAKLSKARRVEMEAS
ncbi:zinc finger protein Gfi-1b-like [Dendronephthya gigantea]|uniref:zinc finger protein Gfi-1b-like n=1 Tax=Dendronephthya gigantea TaxID=151771 RepID=UPI00106C580B|nr:zinc finger protein Gfi-1b-like [Dendronephthya gigantea]